jgi:hypothetical protein
VPKGPAGRGNPRPSIFKVFFLSEKWSHKNLFDSIFLTSLRPFPSSVGHLPFALVAAVLLSPRIQTCKLARPAPSALAPRLFRDKNLLPPTGPFDRKLCLRKRSIWKPPFCTALTARR